MHELACFALTPSIPHITPFRLPLEQQVLMDQSRPPSLSQDGAALRITCSFLAAIQPRAHLPPRPGSTAGNGSPLVMSLIVDSFVASLTSIIVTAFIISFTRRSCTLHSCRSPGVLSLS